MINHFNKNHVTDSTKTPDPSSVPSKHMQNATKTYGTVLKNKCVITHVLYGSKKQKKYNVYVYTYTTKK